jgi:hypothetical protein
LKLATAWIGVIASAIFRLPGDIIFCARICEKSRFCLVDATFIGRFTQQANATVDERLNKCFIQFVAFCKYF